MLQHMCMTGVRTHIRRAQAAEMSRCAWSQVGEQVATQMRTKEQNACGLECPDARDLQYLCGHHARYEIAQGEQRVVRRNLCRGKANT